MSPHAAVGAIRRVLAKGGRAALLPRIARSFKRLSERERKKDEIVLTVAREKDERYARSAAKRFLSALGVAEEGLKTRVDDTIIGGWRLEGRGVLVDNSYKQRLLELYDRVTK